MVYDKSPADVALLQLCFSKKGHVLSIDRCAPGAVDTAGNPREKCSNRLVRQIWLLSGVSWICTRPPGDWPGKEMGQKQLDLLD
jgi:hypothetical protein